MFLLILLIAQSFFKQFISFFINLFLCLSDSFIASETSTSNHTIGLALTYSNVWYILVTNKPHFKYLANNAVHNKIYTEIATPTITAFIFTSTTIFTEILQILRCRFFSKPLSPKSINSFSDDICVHYKTNANYLHQNTKSV